MNKLLIRFRRDKASETLADARMPSCMMAARPPRSGGRALINERFVEVGIAPLEHGRLCARMHDF